MSLLYSLTLPAASGSLFLLYNPGLVNSSVMAGDNARIRWKAQDVEVAPALSQRLDRTTSSISINSASRRASIDPASALPIEYRTM